MFCHDVFSEPSMMALTAELRRLRQEDHASQDCRAAESSVMPSVYLSQREKQWKGKQNQDSSGVKQSEEK